MWVVPAPFLCPRLHYQLERPCRCRTVLTLLRPLCCLRHAPVAVGGSLNSGKSTLVAVLTQGSYGRPLLDNGHGSARMAVFRHKHEIESGRTSSISQQMLGYDEEGKVGCGGAAA